MKLYFSCYSMNAPVMVELEGETDPLKIAMKELKLVTLCCCSIHVCCYMSVITVTSYWGIIGYTVLSEYHWMEQYKSLCTVSTIMSNHEVGFGSWVIPAPIYWRMVRSMSANNCNIHVICDQQCLFSYTKDTEAQAVIVHPTDSSSRNNSNSLAPLT